jgi:hypothetical protein
VCGHSGAFGFTGFGQKFLIDIESGEASTWSVAEDVWPKAFPTAPGELLFTGDSEKFRSMSLGDK